MHFGPNDKPVHGIGCQRTKIVGNAAYQIYAVKAVVDCIHQNRGNGYIWHTTGSGKNINLFLKHLYCLKTILTLKMFICGGP